MRTSSACPVQNFSAARVATPLYSARRHFRARALLTSALAVTISLMASPGAFAQVPAPGPAPAAPAPAPDAAPTPPPDAPPSAPDAPPSAPPDAPTTEDEVESENSAPSESPAPDEPAPEPVPEAAPEPSEDEAALDAEDAALLEGEDPSRPPPKGMGVLWGVVSDAVEKESLPEATVTVVGTKFKTVADIEGRYRLELPPGRYTLRFFFELYRPALVKDIVVAAGKVERLDADVLPDEAATETFEVETQADTASVEGQVLARQRAGAVGDGVGRSEISKSPASNAAQAAQRVVGANIVGNRFVYVRGLGERYTNALLNDAPLPSPEPDRAAIPLDVFPALILDNINIVKTFTPDVPADFAGGSVRIQTRELPSKPLFQVSMGLGYDDRATFRDRLAQRGSPTDPLGFDSGMRQLPKFLDDNLLIDVDAEEQADEIQRASRDLNSYMSAIRQRSGPNYSLSVVGGNGWALPNDQRFGALATLNYGRTFTRRSDWVLRRFIPGGNGLMPATDYRGELGNDRVSWGALGTASYWPSPAHRLTLLGMRTQIADSQAFVVQGFNDTRSAEIVNMRLEYVSRALDFGQLRGEHDFKALSNARLDWNASVSRAERDQPDTRDVVMQRGPGEESYGNITTPENGRHFFADQSESTVGGGFDWTQPLGRAAESTKLKAGALFSHRARDFRARRFHFEQQRGFEPFRCDAPFSIACPDDLYVGSNIGSQLGLVEDTQRYDLYEASLDIYAGYLMTDVLLASDLRLLGGARVEVTDQAIDPRSPFEGGTTLERASIESTDLLPALSLVYSATKPTKLRASVSRTLARPQIRELSPVEFQPVFGALGYSGNTELELTYINNADLRFEYYPTQREVMAFSFFFKDFEDPIEDVVIASGDGIVKPQNARGGKLLGLELEARKSLDFLSEALADFSAIANLTLARSRVELERTPTTDVTSFSRPMVNQAPFVVNLALDYANDDIGTAVRLLYNVSGRRIVEVGTRTLPDAYEQPKHLVDLSVSQDAGDHIQLKLSATNLLAAKTVVTLGSENRDDRVQLSYRDPRVFSFSASYTY